jgi:hypothetical protein
MKTRQTAKKAHLRLCIQFFYTTKKILDLVACKYRESPKHEKSTRIIITIIKNREISTVGKNENILIFTIVSFTPAGSL